MEGFVLGILIGALIVDLLASVAIGAIFLKTVIATAIEDLTKSL